MKKLRDIILPLLLIIFFVSFSIYSYATSYTVIPAGGQWSANATWGGSGHPGLGDTALLTGLNGTLTVDITSNVEKIDMTGSNGTMAFGAYTLNVGASGTGNVTLGGNITSGAAGGITIKGISTLTGNGIAFPGNMNFNSASVSHLVGPWNNTGLTTISAAANIDYSTNVTTETYTASNGLTLSATTGTVGTANIILAGGTWTGTISTIFNSPLIINPTFGNVTITNYLYYKSTTPLLYIHSGTNTVTTTGSTLITTLSPFSTDDGTGHIDWDTISYVLGTNITNATNLWCNTFNLFYSGMYSVNYTMTAGTTLHVATAVNMSSAEQFKVTITSSTTSPAYFNYQGTQANMNISNIPFTYIDASGSAIPIWDYNAGILTSTVNISSVNASNINAGSVCVGASGVAY